MADPVIEQIEAFRCRRGSLTAGRRNRGYTLYNVRSGVPVARLRPTDTDGRYHILYWSLWKERWMHAGPLGRPSSRSSGTPVHRRRGHLLGPALIRLLRT